MLHEPIPTPYFNVACDHDCSDECTIVTSNAGRSECANNLISDDGTVSTQLSTDLKSKSNDKNTRTEVPMGIYIPQHAFPWGGKSTNKFVAKRKQRIKERVKRRELKGASNSQFETRGEIWKKMVADGKLQQLANTTTMFNTQRLVHLVKYALSDSDASSHFVIKGSPAVNIKIAEFPIAIK